jgi:hypothetical protein
MATPTLGLLNHTEIDDADSNTDWTTLDTADPDIKKEGTNAMVGVLRADLDTGEVTKATAISCSGEHLRLWINTINAPYMSNEAGGGYEVYVSDGTNTDYVTVFGSDTYPGGWFNIVVDCALFTTVTAANVDTWGIRANHDSNAKNADNTWVDFVRYSDGYYITGGTSGDKVRLSDIATADKGTTTLYGYGIIESLEGVFFASGEVQLGNGATTTYFEMDGDVLVFTDKPVADGLYAINGNGSGADILIVNSTIKASGTGDDNRPDIDMSTDSPGTVSITDTVFIKCGTFVFASGQTITGNTFNDCQQITPGGADLTDCAVAGYEGTAGTGALLYNVAADPDGELDNMYFEKGTAATHAIQFDATNTPTTITLRGIDFSGYNAVNGNNDSALYFPSTTKSYTVNLVGCTGDISYRVGSGGSVSLVTDPLTVTVTVEDQDQNTLQHAHVYINKPASIQAYTADSGNTAGNGALIVNEVVDTVIPQLGWCNVWIKSLNKLQQYRFSSWTSKTFTFPTTVSNNCTGGGTSTSLQDTANDFTALDIEVGDTVRNTTDGSWAVVDEITDADNIVTTPLSGGSDNTWTSGDTYSFHDLATTLTDNDDLVDIPLSQQKTDGSGQISQSIAGNSFSILIRARYTEGATKYDYVETTQALGTSDLNVTIALTEQSGIV